MKLKVTYKYMDTWMLIGLVMFQTGDQQMVSCFFWEVVLLIKVARINQ